MEAHLRRAVLVAALCGSLCSTAHAAVLGAPADSNPNIPGISPGVTLIPGTAPLDGLETGPVNNITYGPLAFGNSVGGSTGWVQSVYTITGTAPVDHYNLVLEVCDDGDTIVDSALVFDLFQLSVLTPNGTLVTTLWDDDDISWFTPVAGSSAGNDLASTNLAPVSGQTFGWLDTVGTVPTVYGAPSGTEGSVLVSQGFFVSPGTTLSLWANFMTNDGTASFQDYGLIALRAFNDLGEPIEEIILFTADTGTGEPVVPEPGTLALLGLGCAAVIKRRRR